MTQLLNKNKLVAIILCFTMLFSITSGIFTEAFAADETAANTHMVYDVTNGKDITLGHAQKATLTAQGGEQWQIYIYDADMWVDIAGKTGSSMELSYPLVASALTDRGTGELRCRLDDGSYSGIVNLVIDFSTESSYVKETEEEKVVVLTDTEELLEEADEELLEEEEVLDENQDEVLDENIDDPAEENTDENLDEDTTEETPADGTTEENTEQTTPDSTTDNNTTQEPVVQQPADTTTGEDNVTTPEPSNTQNGSSELTAPETPKSETVTKEEPSLLDKLADGIKDKVSGAIDSLKNFLNLGSSEGEDEEEEQQPAQTPADSELEKEPAALETKTQEVKKEAAPATYAAKKTTPVMKQTPQATEPAATNEEESDANADDTANAPATFALTRPSSESGQEEPSTEDELYEGSAEASGTSGSSMTYALMTAEDDDEPKEKVYVVINYVFGDGEIAFDPYSAELAYGSNFSATVTFPVVQGYLPYIGEAIESEASIGLNYTNIQENQKITVTYKPTNVNYTVIHYQQNVDDDEYTVKDTEILQGLTNSTVLEVAKTYTGFYALLYERPAIGADGQTVVEVYYDRAYYLMNFNMDGGYGTEPIYAQYGAAIENVKNPTKAGYQFKGWSLDGVNVTELAKTMPAANTTYVAIWEELPDAKVTVVFWGENANDTEYSYIKSSELYLKPGSEYTYSTDGPNLICLKAEHVHGTDCDYCDVTEHTHGEGCYTLTCQQEVHSHSSACYTCNQTSHTHDTSCYDGVGDATSHIAAPGNPVNGQIYTWNIIVASGKSIYINGTWYKYSGSITTNGSVAPTKCGKTEGNHPHTDTCLGCGKTTHTHTDYTGDCYTLTCKSPAHTHSGDCCSKTAHSHSEVCYKNGSGLDSALWTLKESDTVTVAADGSSVVNVKFERTKFTLGFRSAYSSTNNYGTITAKWGSNIYDEWRAICATAGDTNNWTVNYDGSGPWTSYIGVMPAENITYYGRNSSSSSTAYYYFENLEGEYLDTDRLSVTAEGSNLSVTKEDRVEFEGFTHDESNSTQNGKSYNGAKFYYTRNIYEIVFNDGYDDVKKETVKYEAPLLTYSSFEPTAPSAYEPGSVRFGGWYQNPECTGEPYALTTHTMPAKNLLLYAKWVPVTHKVEFYLDKDALNEGTKIGDTHPDLTVSHGSIVKKEKLPEEPDNDDYTFSGWFYMDNGVEKAFDFVNMPITKDMKVYAKWSSNVLKNYTVYYKIQGTDTQIADPTTGSGLAGNTKTFDAKGDTDLYTAYQSGFYPLTKSHSITLDIEDETKNVYTFWYVERNPIPYTVKYINKATGQEIIDAKVVSENRKAVVTETSVRIKDMLPDAYQKRLVVSAEEGAVNEIIFYYTEDKTHAYYTITHWIQNLEGGKYTEYASSEVVGTINQTYTASQMTIQGFEYNAAKSTASGRLTEAGLELNLYYDRKSYPYKVRYLEYQKDPENVLSPDKVEDAEGNNLAGIFGDVVSESAISIPNYTIVGNNAETLIISSVAENNVITFYYKEKTVPIKYEVVGPDGCGSVSPTAEPTQVKVLTGSVTGSTAAPSSAAYKFVGWFKNEDCTDPVDPSWVDANNTLKPQQEKGESDNVAVFKEATYYAKFDYNLMDLKIQKVVTSGLDANQTFIFNVKGVDGTSTEGFNLRVVVHGAGSVTIPDVPYGEYTVTEETGWSWRYDFDAKNSDYKDTTQDNGRILRTFTMVNNREKTKWLDISTWVKNWFGDTSATRPSN